MKSAILFAFAFVSSVSFACPDLSGSYNCGNPTGTGILEIKQSGESFTVTMLDGQKFEGTADGKGTETEVSNIKFSTKYSCAADSMSIVSSLINSKKGQSSNLTSTFTFKKVNPAHLAMIMQSDFSNGNPGSSKTTITGECVRK